MSTYMSAEVQEGLDAARKKALRRKNRLHVRIDERVLPILECSDHGFIMDINYAPHLRGFVEIFDGPRHIYNALIVACDEIGGRLHYEFKRATIANDQRPLDYEVAAEQPVGLLR